MNIVLTIEANSFDEIAHLFNTPRTAPPASEPTLSDEPEAEVAEEVVEPAPKKTRARRADAAKQDTPDTKSPPESSDGPTATTAASPSDEPVSFDDIRAKASALLDSGKVDGRAVQEMLTAKFDVRAFTALKPEQFADCLAELNNLG